MNKNSINDFTSGHTPAGRGDLPSLPQSPGEGRPSREKDRPNARAGGKNTQAGGVRVPTEIGTTLCCQNDDLNNQGAARLGSWAATLAQLP